MGIAEKALVLKRDFDEVYKAGASDFGLKGKGQGEFVHLEPVHPIEHKVTVGLSSKNLFDISKIESTAVITNNNDGTLTISGTYSARTGKTLGELCPPLKVGDTVVFQVETTGNPLIYLSGSNYTWNTGSSKTVTEADLTSIVVLYGKSDSGTYTISNIQIEAGTIATAYAPYIADFADCKVKVSGKNTDYEPYISAEYTAAADGTVENVKSISPVMNISTDKAGAVIDAECFLDPQAVITDLTNTVITLGGEI